MSKEVVSAPVVYYRSGYKYQVARDYCIQTPVRPDQRISLEFITLDSDGMLHIRSGYAWDGPSGPTIDTKSSIRPSLDHDALYQLMRCGRLGKHWRPTIDNFLYTELVGDGMWVWRAGLWRREVSKFAASAADPTSRKLILTAP